MPRRNPTRGFVLLDALVAFALVALVLTAVYLALPTTATRGAERLNRLQATEFAVSILEEYRMTFPLMPAEGEDRSGWSWTLTEREVSPEPPGSMDALLSYHEVTATVWHVTRPTNRQTLTTLIARRRT
jgi:type II secretory pathway pseudopilin PulG